MHRHQALYGEDDSLYDYLLSAYHIEGMTELALKHRDKIVLSEAPTGVEHIQIILEAIDKKRGIECNYYSYNKKSVKQQKLTEFEKYRIVQDRLFQSDFDKFLGELPFEGE